MKNASRTVCCFTSLVCLLIIPSIARADGAIGFLNTGSSTLTAGAQFSWMDRGGGDWSGVMTDTVVDSMMVTHARLSNTLPREITVVTSRDATNLIMVFTIDDSTRVKPGTGNPLSEGDKIIIQIDPNNSRSPQLQIGAANSITADYRFEIVINGGAIVANRTGIRMPEALSGMENNWAALSPLAFATVSPTMVAPFRYVVTANIPLARIGMPTSDIGICFAVLNDVGFTASNGFPDVTGSEFPLSMGLDTVVNDLGFVDTEQATGTWIHPNTWGTGFFSFVPQNVNFTLSPSFYWSASLKLSKCNVDNWDDVPASGIGTNQLLLGPNWYRYNENDPCNMRIWFNVFKSNPGAVKRRFVIFWGRPGISPRNWIFVALTDPIVLTNTETRSFFTWNNVPAVTFSDHPCLRVYILPETLIAPFDDVGAFSAIDLASELAAMESTYMLQPNGSDMQSAQMNFTATEPGTSCPTGSPCACLDSPSKSNAVARNNSLQFLDYGGGGSDGEPFSAGLLEAQAVSQGEGTVRITAEAFGVPAAGLSQKPYNYLERLGGIAWSIRQADLVKRQKMELRLEISNPLLLRRDFTGATPVDVKSPRRSIMLVINIEASPGTPLPIIVSQPANPTLDPGETTKGTITIVPGGGPPSGSFKHWGLSLHGGVSFPHGNFNNVFNPGPNFALDLEYRINPTFSLEGIYGYHRFNGETFGAFTVADLNVHQFSLNGKVYGSSTPVRPFFNFGGGAYVFSPGVSTHGGLNFGGGVQFDVTPTFAVEGVYNFHNVFTSGSNTRFSAVQGGVRFRF